MTRLLFYTIICAIAFYAYRVFQRQSIQVTRHRRGREEVRRPCSCRTLVRDLQTGEYHIVQDKCASDS